MGKLSSFTVKFPGNYDVVYAGGKLSGWVCINVRTDIQVLSIKIAITGRAKTHWFEASKKSGSGRKISTGGHKMPFDGLEEYFAEEFVLLQGTAGQDSVRLPGGSHKFPFEFQIPKCCPTSFESEYGFIRYFLKATIAKPSGFDNIVKKVFTVLAKRDLSKDPVAGLKPVKETKYQSYRTMKLKTGKMVLTVSLPRPGFVPGQYLDLEAEVQIVGDRIIRLVDLSLQRLDTFKGKNSSEAEMVKSQEKTIASASVDVAVVGGKESQMVDFSNFRIPPLPPAVDGCGLITISYSLIVRAVTNKSNFFVEIIVPITIGTVPFKSSFKRIICAKLGRRDEKENGANRKKSEYANDMTDLNGEGREISDSNLMMTQSDEEAKWKEEEIQLIDSEDIPDKAQGDGEEGMENNDQNAPTRKQTGTRKEKSPVPTYEECIFGRRNMIEEDEDEIIYGTVDYAPKYPVYQFLRLADLENDKG